MKKLMMACAVVALSAWAPPGMAAGEVRLLQAESYPMYNTNPAWHVGAIEARVKNLGPNKQVFVHLKTAYGGWVDLPLHHSYDSSSNTEVWITDRVEYSYYIGLTDVVEFSMKYVVNGITYWDNNAAANYRLPKDAGTMLGRGINIRAYSPSATFSSGIAGVLTLRSMPYAKKVKLHYSLDAGATIKTVNATFRSWPAKPEMRLPPNPNLIGTEMWEYSLDIPAGTSSIYYAFSYTVNGKTYWDNNGGTYYRANYGTVGGGRTG